LRVIHGGARVAHATHKRATRFHDAILVPHSVVTTAEATMKEAFKVHTGIDVDVTNLLSPLLAASTQVTS
jgi:hypothetical protein